MSYVSLTPLDIALAAALLFANGLISWGFRLRLEMSIAIAAVRMVVQLALIGVEPLAHPRSLHVSGRCPREPRARPAPGRPMPST